MFSSFAIVDPTQLTTKTEKSRPNLTQSNPIQPNPWAQTFAWRRARVSLHFTDDGTWSETETNYCGNVSSTELCE